MSESTQYFSNQLHGMMLSINTAFPAEVLSYDAATRTAKIQPKFQVKEVGKVAENVSPIENVPVLMHIPTLQPGYIVQIICNQRSLEGALVKGKTVCPSKARIFSMHDAVVIGVITT